MPEGHRGASGGFAPRFLWENYLCRSNPPGVSGARATCLQPSFWPQRKRHPGRDVGMRAPTRTGNRGLEGRPVRPCQKNQPGRRKSAKTVNKCGKRDAGGFGWRGRAGPPHIPLHPKEMSPPGCCPAPPPRSRPGPAAPPAETRRAQRTRQPPRAPASRPFRLAANLPPLSLSSGASQSRGDTNAEGRRGGTSRPDFPIGGFL